MIWGFCVLSFLCVLFAPGVERKQADSLPGRPGTGGGGGGIYSWQLAIPVSQKTWSVSRGSGRRWELGYWARPGAGPIYCRLLSRWRGCGVKWRGYRNLVTQEVEGDLPGLPPLPPLIHVFPETWAGVASWFKEFCFLILPPYPFPQVFKVRTDPFRFLS